MPDFTRAEKVTPEVEEEIENAFKYHAWNKDQEIAGNLVRMSLEIAVKAIVDNVPPCPDRTTAIRKLREARMDANSAITHKGRY